MATKLQLRCNCGALKGYVAGATPENGNHVVCYCDDCQAFARWLGTPIMDDRGGSQIYQTTPAQIHLTEGSEQLRLLRLSPKGLLRWYSACCRTPVANMIANPKSPFVGLISSFIEDPSQVGPVVAKIQGRYARGGCPEGVHPRAPLSLIWRSVVFLGKGWWNGASQPSPFFQNGQPIVEAQILSKEERAAVSP